MENKRWKITLLVMDRKDKKNLTNALLDEDEMNAFARNISRDINEKYFVQVMSSRVEEVSE